MEAIVPLTLNTRELNVLRAALEDSAWRNQAIWQDKEVAADIRTAAKQAGLKATELLNQLR